VRSEEGEDSERAPKKPRIEINLVDSDDELDHSRLEPPPAPPTNSTELNALPVAPQVEKDDDDDVVIINSKPTTKESSKANPIPSSSSSLVEAKPSKEKSQGKSKAPISPNTIVQTITINSDRLMKMAAVSPGLIRTPGMSDCFPSASWPSERLPIYILSNLGAPRFQISGDAVQSPEVRAMGGAPTRSITEVTLLLVAHCNTFSSCTNLMQILKTTDYHKLVRDKLIPDFLGGSSSPSLFHFPPPPSKLLIPRPKNEFPRFGHVVDFIVRKMLRDHFGLPVEELIPENVLSHSCRLSLFPQRFMAVVFARWLEFSSCCQQ